MHQATSSPCSTRRLPFSVRSSALPSGSESCSMLTVEAASKRAGPSPRIEQRGALQPVPELALRIGRRRRNDDAQQHVEIARLTILARLQRDALSAQPQTPAGAGAFRDLELERAAGSLE